MIIVQHDEDYVWHWHNCDQTLEYLPDESACVEVSFRSGILEDFEYLIDISYLPINPYIRRIYTLIYLKLVGLFLDKREQRLACECNVT